MEVKTVWETNLNMNISEELWTKIQTMQTYKSVLAKFKEIVLKSVHRWSL